MYLKKLLLRNSLLGLAACTAMPSPRANAQAVRVNWQTKAPFADYKTYAWKISQKQEDGFYRQWVVQFGDAALAKAGLQKVSGSQKPDLLIAYHFTTQEMIDATTTTDGFGWGGGPWMGGRWGAWGGWGGWGGMGEFNSDMSTTEEHPRMMGILTVDLLDPKTKQLVWRGQATEDSVARSQKGDEKQVRKSIDKMFDRYPPKQP